jgi:glycosyltransferase involved in cell wall biosynthesis
MVAETGLSDTVTFLGPRRDVPELLDAADVAVHASTIPEPGGIVVMEAMALGKAVIAANEGGHTEVVWPDAGLLFDTREPEQLAVYLAELVEDPARREELGAAARRRIEEFSLERNVRDTQSVYANLLS